MTNALRSTVDQPHESGVATESAIYAPMAARDLEQLPLPLDEHVVITRDPALPGGGRFEGHDGFSVVAATLTGTITSQVEISSIFAADGEVTQTGRIVGTVNATGVEFDIAEVHRWTLVDGKAVRAHFAVDTRRCSQPSRRTEDLSDRMSSAATRTPGSHVGVPPGRDGLVESAPVAGATTQFPVENPA